jgi:hypothetical protein
MFGRGILEQGSEQGDAFFVGNTPADYSAAREVADDVEMEVRRFGEPINLVKPDDQTLLGACANGSGCWQTRGRN